MYGALTREIVPWQPSRLLCKRFGVKDPNPDITTDTPMPGVPNTAGGNTWNTGRRRRHHRWLPVSLLLHSLLQYSTLSTTSSLPCVRSP
jgi:G patch domain-containing protein 1